MTITATFSRTWLLKTFLERNFKRRTTSRRTCNRKLVLWCNKPHWNSPLFTFSGVWHRPTATRGPSLWYSSTNWKSPTSTTSELRTVVWGAASPTVDDATVPAPNQRCRVSLNVFLRSTTILQHALRSAITGPASIPKALEGSNSELCPTASAVVTAVFSMLIPVSEKKFLWVSRGWRSKSWTYVTAPLTFWWLIATPSRDTVKMGCNFNGPLSTRAVNWNTWKQHMWKIIEKPGWLETL